MTDDFFDGMAPETAYEIGESMGRYKAEVEAAKAFDMGEIDQWIEYITPKTWEDWEAWHKENGEGFEKRWKV